MAHEGKHHVNCWHYFISTQVTDHVSTYSNLPTFHHVGRRRRSDGQQSRHLLLNSQLHGNLPP